MSVRASIYIDPGTRPRIVAFSDGQSPFIDVAGETPIGTTIRFATMDELEAWLRHALAQVTHPEMVAVPS